jgi:hypothetical protein
MSQATYTIYSGSEPVTNVRAAPLTDLEQAKLDARRISEMDNQRDATITVRSHKVELQGLGEWRGIAAVFINGEEIASDDKRYPHDVNP